MAKGNKELDVRGVTCPVNAVRVKQAVSGLGAGENLRVIVDEGESVVRVVRSMKDAGHRILKAERTDDGVVILITKSEN